ncbi:sll0787 family AIR synthase-like protein [Variovorax sp. KK3]|uniref:sll0787 family AIR synthase-like protein n=1 Tax=Variovorax sp. KK3 TaxID=1855728 RepID=UPI00097C3EA4|nr:sll0787 family AIR synthase-like protein [Variovorax sp. KK3]
MNTAHDILASLLDALRCGRGFAHKRDIAQVMGGLVADDAADAARTAVPNGDDCAALPLPGGGYQLLAIEGLMPDFVQQQPWFAGYSAVMVNLSDVAAMGGRPVAVVDALWSSAGSADAGRVIEGMQAACRQYGVPLVGGHTNLHSATPQLAVAVLGRAERLISSFAARPDDRLLMAVDLRGAWEGDAPFWNASTRAPAPRLQADLALLAELAEEGLCDAGKDISMAGALGTLLMLLECSGRGARVRLDALPVPPQAAGWRGWTDPAPAAQAARLRWLSAFPSYGFVLSVRPEQVAAVTRRFANRDIACADIGEVTAGTRFDVSLHGATEALWDLSRAGFILPLRTTAHAATEEPCHA